MKKLNFKDITYSLYELDGNLNIVSIDKEFTNITGYTKNDIKKNNINQSDLIFDEDKKDYFSYVKKRLKHKSELYLEHRLKRKDGKEIYVYCLGELTENGKTKIRILDLYKSVYVSIRQNEIEQKYNSKMKKIVNQATIDPLTKTLRRETYIYKVENYIKNNVDFYFIMIDIDYFKNINDKYGHDIGDQILTKVTKIFNEEVSKYGIVGRMGGDEFSISLVSMKENEMKKILNSIINKVGKIKIKEDKNFMLTMSAGVSYKSSELNKTFNDIYIETDKLLYESKNNGRDQITYQ